jgi:hypothetical protein
MCHNTPQVCQCNPTTIIPADEEQLKRIANLLYQIQDKPEPVGWIGYFEGNIVSFFQSREQVNIFLENTGPAGQVVRVYAEPPKKEWIGLTDEEIDEIWSDDSLVGNPFVRAIEAKLKEKNT